MDGSVDVGQRTEVLRQSSGGLLRRQYCRVESSGELSFQRGPVGHGVLWAETAVLESSAAAIVLVTFEKKMSSKDIIVQLKQVSVRGAITTRCCDFVSVCKDGAIDIDWHGSDKGTLDKHRNVRDSSKGFVAKISSDPIEFVVCLKELSF